MEERRFKTYPYRWAVLAVFMGVNLTIQVLWISYAPITGQAARFYGVGDLQIGFFSMLFMLAFIPLSIPASWAIDTWGFRTAVGIGAVLMAVFGLLRGFAGSSYALALAGTVGVAVAQPFLLNAWTKVPAKWFPADERATAVGLVTLSNLAGTALGMVLTPILAQSMSIPRIELVYGAVTALSSLLFIAFARERPPTPPCEEGGDQRALMFDGLKHAFSVSSFNLYLAISFVGIGIFNGVATWIEAIVRPRGIGPEEAGTLGALMLVAGVLGAVVLPPMSDKRRRRKPFLLIGMAFGAPGLLGLAIGTSFPLLCVSAIVLGFFLVSAMPIGMQYAAEITQPTPEGTSNGLIQLFGQASVVFVYVMAAMRSPSGSFAPALFLALGLLALNVFLVALLRESGPVPVHAQGPSTLGR
ncbi:MAG: MFS transporter [Rectinemataceae bacterium]